MGSLYRDCIEEKKSFIEQADIISIDNIGGSMFSEKKGHRQRVVVKNENNVLSEPIMEGFDPVAFSQSLSARTYAINRQLIFDFTDEMDEGVIAYWESYGVKKEIFDCELNEGRNKYSVHTPTDLDVGKKYPLLYYSHGGFGTPFQAETVGFSKLIKSEQMIVVYPFNGGYSNEEAPTEFIRILDELKKKDYPIDWSRIYVSGYSSGSDATESIATLWPELIAAAAPCPGSNAMYNSLCRKSLEAYEKCLNYQVPLLCVGGTMDYGDQYPFPDKECYENFNIWMEKISRVHKFKAITYGESRMLIERTDNKVKKSIGVDFETTWIEHLEEREWYFGEFYDEFHRPVVRFVCGEGIPHITSGIHASLVWNWLKLWSRDLSTGKLVYTSIDQNSTDS